MAQTRLRIAEQLAQSTTPGSILISNASNKAEYLAPPTGNKILFFDDTTSNLPTWLTVGSNLSIDTGTNTLNASAGAGGYATVQEEGSDLTARTKINFVGAGFTAADDAGNTRTNVTLDATLNALAAYNTNGFIAQTSADNFAGRTITGAASRIDVSNGDGMVANPIIDIHASYVGQSSITTLGTIGTGVWQGTAVGAAYGGTGQTSYTIGDLIYASGATTLSKLNDVATGNVLISGGVATAPSWGKIGLTTHVSGTLGETNGGTGQAAYTAGDLIYAAATNTLSRRAIGSSGNFLRVSAGFPVWTTAASTDLSDASSIAMLGDNETVSGTWTFSNNITMNGTPSANTDVVTVGYVNTLIANQKWTAVQYATTANITLSGEQSIDGFTTSASRVLVKDQSSTAANGIYTTSSGAWTRATDMNAASEVDGTVVVVQDGSTNAGSLWVTVSEVTTLGTDPIVWTQINKATDLVAGNGLDNTGLTWFVGTASTSRIVVNANNIDLATTAATPGSFGSATQVATYTVDAYGRLTASGNTTISIPSTAVSDFTEAVQDVIGALSTDTNTIDWTYTDGSNTLTADVKTQMSITSDASGIKLSGDASTPGNNYYYGTNGSGTKGWYASSTGVAVTRVWIESSTASTIDLSVSGNVKDIDGGNTTFSIPTDHKLVSIYRNGIRLSETGSLTTRDYSFSGTSLVLTTALTTDEIVVIEKIA